MGFCAAPLSTLVERCCFCAEMKQLSALWSKWSLPRALLRMVKRHPSRNCAWGWGEGVTGFWWWKDKNHNVQIITITYLAIMQQRKWKITRYKNRWRAPSWEHVCHTFIHNMGFYCPYLTTPISDWCWVFYFTFISCDRPIEHFCEHGLQLFFYKLKFIFYRVH